MWSLALSAVRAHRAALAGAALTLAAAGGVLSIVGVLMESGLRGGADVDTGTLTTLASSYAGIALVVVILVVAATVTLALRGRRREFALLRTIGATPTQVRRQISREVLSVALVAVPVGAVPGVLLARRLVPLLRRAGILGAADSLVLSPLPVVAAIAVLAPSAVLAGRLAARETVRASALAAVRSSAVDQAPVGGTRRLLAVLCAVAGLAAAGAPAVVPGTVGGATAATSAFLLIGAVALAGPLLVRAAFGRVGLRGGGPAGVAARLAVLNVRGFSRRLTAVVVPLTLALAVGAVQASVDLAVGKAAAQQLRAAVTADLVVTGDQSTDRVAGLAAVSGVSDAVPLADLRIKVRTDDDDLPDSLVWELSALKVVPADAPRTTFDPGITRGSLAALSGRGTVAISSDAAFEQGVGAGDRVAVRYGGAEHRLRVVAVFDRGLGLGDYLTGPATAAALGATPSPDATLVSVSGAGSGAGSAKAATAARLTALGLTVLTPEEYVAGVSSGTAATQHLSTVLLLLLLVFVGLGAANALVLTTAGRRAELALLHRTGATRRQLLQMAFVESALTGGLAWLVGTLVVIPAVVGVSAGLLGWHVPVVDLGTYAVVSSAVLVVAVGATVLPTAWVLRHRPTA